MKFDQNVTQGNSMFLKLKDGDKKMGVCRGDILSFRQHWSNNKSVLCTKAEGACPLCDKGSKSSFRFHLNFITRNDAGDWEAKLFAGGSKIYQALKSLHESDYNLEKTIIVISRHGTTKDDTTYTILPARDCEVTPDREASISRVKLLDLKPGNKAMEESDSHHEDSTENIPF